MEYKYFDTNDSDEISLYVFSAEPTEFDELTEFGYACAEKGYNHDSQMQKNHAEKYGYEYKLYPWEDYLKNYISEPSSITIPMFLDKRDYCLCMTRIENLYPKLKESDVESAMILNDEWNDILVVARLTDRYVGYWWQTTV